MPRMRFPEVAKASSAVLSGVVGGFFQEFRQIFPCISPFQCHGHSHGHASQCQGWDFQKLSRRPQLSCRGSSVVSFKNPDKSFPCISPFQCHGHGHGHTSQCQGWNLNFQKLSGSCPGLSLNNLQTNHFRNKTKDKEFCDSGITFRWIPLELLCLTSFHLLLLS